MFEATIKDISILRDSISTIAELIDETEIIIKQEGIELLASDRAVVVVVSFFLHDGAFDEYHCDKEQRVGLNLQNFLQILKRAGADDTMKISLKENKMHITFHGDSTRNFVLPLIDVSKEDTPDLEKLEGGFSAHVTASSDILNSGIEDAELVADSVVITLRKDLLAMKAESDTSSSQLEIPQGEYLKIEDINTPVRARYSLDYLKKILKARKLSKDARISLATDYPLKILFDVPQKTRLSFILAPRVDES